MKRNGNLNKQEILFVHILKMIPFSYTYISPAFRCCWSLLHIHVRLDISDFCRDSSLDCNQRLVHSSLDCNYSDTSYYKDNSKQENATRLDPVIYLAIGRPYILKRRFRESVVRKGPPWPPRVARLCILLGNKEKSYLCSRFAIFFVLIPLTFSIHETFFSH